MVGLMFNSGRPISPGIKPRNVWALGVKRRMVSPGSWRCDIHYDKIVRLAKCSSLAAVKLRIEGVHSRQLKVESKQERKNEREKITQIR